MIAWSIWILAYISGSIPCGALIARSRNVNIQEHGSGNIGATNVARTLGKKAGVFTLIGDCLKGLLPVALADQVLNDSTQIAVTGFIAFVGHIFSVFLRFKGGKGVATGFGIFLYLMPWAASCSVIVFALTLTATGYVSASSILATLVLPATGAWLGVTQSYVFSSVAVALIIVQKHRDNIHRLIDGTETKFLKK